ncbi:TauD/TfdA family dioxygenase [Acetobacter sicerae]|uniref:TauD/TfdA family dioxygenase n=1 Tax=Acetobacter sicerae TaxID=85325 RepID=A0ABS8VZA8_9PROT|nr:TauD/TfdA family dioxygenase [Acetobacter tropicalis]MBC9009765.1 TauD/TfdA family dioxygenase [Acetobacter tropicalis]MCE0743871.1 TauD/TfdA family dioxygenase [Acetobacter sicerae]
MSNIRFILSNTWMPGVERNIRELTARRLEDTFRKSGITEITRINSELNLSVSSDILQVTSTSSDGGDARTVIFFFPSHSRPHQRHKFMHDAHEFVFSAHRRVAASGVEAGDDIVHGKLAAPAEETLVSLAIYKGASLLHLPDDAQARIWADDGSVIGVSIKSRTCDTLILGLGGAFTPPFLGHQDNERYYEFLVDFLIGSRSKTTYREVNVKKPLLPLFQTSAVYPNINHSLEDATFFVDPEEVKQCGFLDGESGDPYDDVTNFLRTAYLRGNRLPATLHDRLYKFRSRDPKEPPVLLLRGLLSQEDVPETPSEISACPDKLNGIPELWIGAIAERLGNAVGYLQEKDGRIFQNLFPTKKNEKKLSSESSLIDLDFHTEIAFHPYLPDYIILFCLRPDHEKVSATFYSTVSEILQNTAERFHSVLQMPQFKTGIDFSFGSNNRRVGNGPITPVLYGDPFAPFLCYDLDLMEGITEQARLALNEIRRAANCTKHPVRLECGDMLIIDNRRAIHGRSNFIPRYDGRDRWLLRTSVVADLHHSAADRPNHPRVIETLFQV